MEKVDFENEMIKIQEETKRLAFECVDEWNLRKSTVSFVIKINFHQMKIKISLYLLAKD